MSQFIDIKDYDASVHREMMSHSLRYVRIGLLLKCEATYLSVTTAMSFSQLQAKHAINSS